jgi:hypothetical protein
LNSKIIVLAAFLSLMLILPTIPRHDRFYAHAACNDASTSNDAFQEDVLCPRDLNKNPVYLNYNITTSNGHTIAKLFLPENSTGEIVEYTTFYIAVNNTENTRQQPSFSDFFQIQNGTLILDFVHNTRISNNSLVQIIGADREQFLNAWVPTYDSKITITNFPVAANKIYIMHVEVFGTDNPHSIYTPEQTPKVDLIFGTNENPNSEGKVLIVPEFGSLVSLVIMAGITGIIIMAAKVRAWKS